MKLYKALTLSLSLLFIGCTPMYHSDNNSSECVGVMSSQDAYGHLNPNHFTMQVLALKEEADIQEYIRHIDPKHPVWVNWKSSRGERWYAVTAGNFATKNQAYRAMEKLPHNVQRSEPFVQSFGQLRQKQQTNVVRMR